jgi:hypothetical protein
MEEGWKTFGQNFRLPREKAKLRADGISHWYTMDSISKGIGDWIRTESRVAGKAPEIVLKWKEMCLGRSYKVTGLTSSPFRDSRPGDDSVL